MQDLFIQLCGWIFVFLFFVPVIGFVYMKLENWFLRSSPRDE